MGKTKSKVGLLDKLSELFKGKDESTAKDKASIESAKEIRRPKPSLVSTERRYSRPTD